MFVNNGVILQWMYSIWGNWGDKTVTFPVTYSHIATPVVSPGVEVSEFSSHADADHQFASSSMIGWVTVSQMVIQGGPAVYCIIIGY